MPASQRARGFFEGLAPVPMRFGGITRPALRAAPDRALVASTGLPGEARVELAVALDCPTNQVCGGARTFRVEARDGQTVAVLAERHVAYSPEAGWQALSVDWRASEAGSARLALSVSAGQGVPTGAAAPVAYWAEPFVARRRPPHKPNVLLISVDTLRADRLGCYGYARPTSPVLDGFASEAVLFRDAISQAPWTTPSHLSMLTSLYPSSHGVTGDFGRLTLFLQGQGSYPSLRSDALTLAELLREQGYDTLALTGGGPMAADFGHARGFNVFEEGGFKLSDGVLARLTGWLDQDRERPFFLFFHTYEVHSPYLRTELAHGVLTEAQIAALDGLRPGEGPGDPVRPLLQRLGAFDVRVTSALYDSGIRYTDRHLGRLFDELRRRDLYDDTLIVVASDHGEEFGEHDPARIYDAHCTNVYEQLIHVPLLMRWPGQLPAGRRVPSAVELVDVAPTVLDLLGLPIPTTMQGRSLVRLARGQDPGGERWTLSEATCHPPEMKALRGGRWKYVAGFGPRGDRIWEKLFDRVQDPGELRPLNDPAEAGPLREALAFRMTELRTSAGAPPTLDLGSQGREELRERLRALGYVE